VLQAVLWKYVAHITSSTFTKDLPGQFCRTIKSAAPFKVYSRFIAGRENTSQTYRGFVLRTTYRIPCQYAVRSRNARKRARVLKGMTEKGDLKKDCGRWGGGTGARIE